MSWLNSARTPLIWTALALSTVFFLATSFRKGWTQVESDFPNYYTAAVLARRHAPLERFYDWTWFQRQMNYAGTETQLGGYIPQTPLTMVPLVPLSLFPPPTAKQIWLILNLVFLGIAAILIARLTGIPPPAVLLIAFAGYFALASNFVLGQYYVFLLFLLTLSVWSLLRNHHFTAGLLLGTVCMLKLYTAPFLLYFLWKRQWRAFLGMLAACLALGAISIAWFGWDANLYYATSMLTRASENAILDPYNASTGTLSTLLRRTFIREPELNPRPFLEAPFAFFLLRPLLTLSILIVPLLAIAPERSTNKREIAWFLIAILLASPNTASYVFILLLLPITMLWDGATVRMRSILLVTYILLCLPLRPAWNWLFPKVWLLALLFYLAGRGSWRNLRPIPVTAAILAIAGLSLWSALLQQSSYDREPSRIFEAVASQPSSIYASSPAVSKAGIVFESMTAGRYVLNRTMAFEGQAFHPAVPASGSPIIFELVAHSQSRVMSFDSVTTTLRALTPADWNATNPSVSPDGDHLAFISNGKLFVLDEGSPIPAPGPVQCAAWFPDATHLALCAQGMIYGSKDLQPLVSNVAGTLSDPAISPDAAQLAFVATNRGVSHIWIENLLTKTTRELTGGRCNSYAPAWDPGSKAIVFASDCDRGLGLPRLYRAPAL